MNTNPKILVVDDKKENLIAMQKSLQSLEVEVMSAHSGEEALSLILEHDFALVLLDVQMPVMDGFETAQLMREYTKTEHIPIIFVTAINKDEINEFKGYKSGAVDFLFKPLDPNILRSKVQVFLDIYNKESRRIDKVMNELQLAKMELEKRNIELSVLAHHDVLTTLPNRLEFEKSIKMTIARAARHKRLFALLFIDLDNFKTINDHLGHTVGDELLCQVAMVLQNNIRTDDVVARLGGDEFAILLTDIHYSYDAGKVATIIEHALHKEFKVKSHTIKVDISMGIACYPFAGKTAEELVKNADIAMYRAKNIKGSSHQYYTTNLQEQYNNRILLEEALSQALDKDEFYFKYQPIYNLQSLKIVGMEALIRWNNNQYKNIGPDLFIPILENMGLIQDVGCFVLEEVMTQYAKWVNQGYENLRYALNLSPLQLNERSLIELVKSMLDKTQMRAELLELELTESALTDYSQTCDLILDVLPDLGIGIAIDDFGTGYSSLLRLKQLPITSLKIDKSFINDIDDFDDEVLVKSIIMLGKNLNLTVTAEGIENEEQLKFLQKNGCVYGQGFYFSKPLAASEMTKLLAQRGDTSE